MTGGHLGAVVLAEYDEGLLPDRLAAVGPAARARESGGAGKRG